MRRGEWATVAPITLLLLIFSLSPTSPASSRSGTGTNPARQYFTDTILLDQDGRSHRFYSDLIAGRVVVINVIFTGCRSSCPIIMGRLAELQDLLGPRMGQIKFLSISVDPVLDTPRALRAYADTLQAGPEWYFLTGSKESVATVLRRLGDRSSRPEDHSDVIVVGNDASGTWVKLTAIASTEDLAQAVAEVANMPAR
jgi:protein SCO1